MWLCESLPHMPQLLAELQENLKSGNTDARTIAKLVSSDVALVAQILRMVNSAYYGLAQPIVNVKLAIAYLGFNQVYRTVLTVSVVNSIGVESRQALGEFWHHSYFTALTAKYLSSVYERHLDPGELWPAALLHDVGKLVYIRLFPEHYEALQSYQRTHRVTLVDAEEVLNYPSHTILGTLLCEQWKLPPAIADTTAHHHDPYAPRTSGTTVDMLAARRMIYVANLLTELATSPLGDGVKFGIKGKVCDVLGCNDAQFMAIMGEVYDLRREGDRFMDEFSW